jgi:hypothetical protein
LQCCPTNLSLVTGARRRQQQQQQQQPPSLWGVVRYEDCVDDEWFVVWLLLHLTQQLPGLTARCWDDDGEFLLIEVSSSFWGGGHRGGTQGC